MTLKSEYQKNKTYQSSRTTFAVKLSNWNYSLEKNPVCVIHDIEAIWHKNKARVSGGQWVCKICSRLKAKGQRRRWRTHHTNPFEYNLKKSFTLAKHNSKKVSREFTITFDKVLDLWKEQNGLCYICNAQMEFLPGDRKRNPKKVTMDRLNSQHGYVIENVALACDRCNTIKSNLSTDELLIFSRNILKKFGDGFVAVIATDS